MKSLIICFFLCVVYCESHAQTIIPFTTQGNTHDLAVPTFCLQSVKENTATFIFNATNASRYNHYYEGTNYSMFYVKGLGVYEEIGKPTLPAYYKWIEVTDMMPASTIISSTSKNLQDINIYPTQYPQIDSDTTNNNPFCIDSALYSTDTYYPKNIVEVSDVVTYQNRKYAVLRICPIQYNPKQKIVRCFSKIKFNLTNYAESSMDERGNRQNNNNSACQDDYFIVCRNNVKYSLTNFITWKKKQGYKVHLISKSSWSNTTQVKDSIRAHYNQCDSSSNKYLLIVGNSSMVPTFHKVYGIQNESVYYVSDYDYSRMGSSYSPNFALGRIPINNSSELVKILNKTIDYQQHPYYYGRSVHVAKFVDASDPNDPYKEQRRFIRTSEDIKSYMETYLGDTISRIYHAEDSLLSIYATLSYNPAFSDGSDLPSELQYPNFLWNGNTADIVTSFNSNNNNYILYRGHGARNGWQVPFLKQQNISQLNNSRFPVVFSITCKTGQFSYNNNNTWTDTICFAYDLLRKYGGGSSAVIAATASSLSKYNDVWIAGLYDTMFPTPGLNIGLQNGSHVPFLDNKQSYSIGQAMIGACNDVLYYFGTDSYALATIELFHCFGDPSTEIYTGQPEDLSVVTVKQINDSLIVDTHGIENCSVLLIPKYSVNSNLFIRKDSISGEFAFSNIRIPYSISLQKHNCAPYYYNAPDIYIQNKDFTDTQYNYIGNHILIGLGVTEEVNNDEVKVKTGASLILSGIESVEIQDCFEVESGGMFEIR